MKLLIINQPQEVIEGYTVVDLRVGLDELEQVINNSCTDIALTNCLDSLNKQEAKSVLNLAASKMRLGAKMSISGIELKSLCRNALNNSLSSDQFSDIISGMNCIFTSNEISELVNSV